MGVAMTSHSDCAGAGGYVMPELSRRAEREMEEVWKLRRDAVRLLGVITSEFKSDPMSVQCFDLRTVQEAIAVVDRLSILEARNPLA